MLMTDDFFRNSLDQMIDLRHPLAVFANRMPWQEIEAFLAYRFPRQVRTGKKTEDADIFRPTVAVAWMCLKLLTWGMFLKNDSICMER